MRRDGQSVKREKIAEGTGFMDESDQRIIHKAVPFSFAVQTISL